MQERYTCFGTQKVYFKDPLYGIKKLVTNKCNYCANKMSELEQAQFQKASSLRPGVHSRQ